MERAFDEAASRSQDNSPHGPNWSGEGEDSENGESKGAAQDGHLINGADLDEVHHDLTAHERREARLRNLLHIMTIESNNLEMHLHALTLRHRRAATLPQIIELYTHHKHLHWILLALTLVPNFSGRRHLPMAFRDSSYRSDISNMGIRN